jgi:hypothetical protein
MNRYQEALEAAAGCVRGLISLREHSVRADELGDGIASLFIARDAANLDEHVSRGRRLLFGPDRLSEHYHGLHDPLPTVLVEGEMCSFHERAVNLASDWLDGLLESAGIPLGDAAEWKQSKGAVLENWDSVKVFLDRLPDLDTNEEVFRLNDEAGRVQSRRGVLSSRPIFADEMLLDEALAGSPDWQASNEARQRPDSPCKALNLLFTSLLRYLDWDVDKIRNWWNELSFEQRAELSPCYSERVRSIRSVRDPDSGAFDDKLVVPDADSCLDENQEDSPTSEGATGKTELPKSDGPYRTREGQNSFVRSGALINLRMEDKQFELFCFLWSRLGSEESVCVDIRDIAKEVWNVRGMQYEAMKSTFSKMNSSLLSCEIVFRTNKPRGRDFVTVTRAFT